VIFLPFNRNRPVNFSRTVWDHFFHCPRTARNFEGFVDGPPPEFDEPAARSMGQQGAVPAPTTPLSRGR